MKYSKGNYKIEMPANRATQLTIQKALIANGCKWVGSGKALETHHVTYLFIEDGLMHYTSRSVAFSDSKYHEIKYQELLKTKADSYEIF